MQAAIRRREERERVERLEAAGVVDDAELGVHVLRLAELGDVRRAAAPVANVTRARGANKPLTPASVAHGCERERVSK